MLLVEVIFVEDDNKCYIGIQVIDHDKIFSTPGIHGHTSIVCDYDHVVRQEYWIFSDR